MGISLGPSRKTDTSSRICSRGNARQGLGCIVERDAESASSWDCMCSTENGISRKPPSPLLEGEMKGLEAETTVGLFDRNWNYRKDIVPAAEATEAAMREVPWLLPFSYPPLFH